MKLYKYFKKTLSMVLCTAFIGASMPIAIAGTNNKGSWGDNGDGTFNNPILPADYSDPDAIRVGDDYFLVTSTFQFVPGITVLHSEDMVNWEILGGAIKDLTRVSPVYNYDSMQRYGNIVWAPCITYNEAQEKFYIHYGDPDEGLFVVSTTKEGIWTNDWSDVEPVLNKNGEKMGGGWNDCGVLWDDDGQGYITVNHFRSGYENVLFKLSEDGTRILDDGVLIHKPNDGLLVGRDEGAPEAYKMFKHDGYYYFLHNAVVSGSIREVFFLRAKNIYGDNEDGSAGTFDAPGKYEHAQRGVVENGYNQWCQGNILDTPDSFEGEKKWYFLTHQGSGAAGIGRPICLVPVEWEDGFPAAENHLQQWENIPKPMPDTEVKRPQTSDTFDGSELSPQWMWSFQPKAGMYSLTENTGSLRMYAYKPISDNRIDRAGNTLMQRTYMSDANKVITKMDVSGMTDGQNAGLVHMASAQYSAIGVAMYNNKKQIALYSPGGNVKAIEVVPEGVNAVYLKSEWGSDGSSTFAYSFDGKTYKQSHLYSLQWSQYRGDTVGFFNYNNNGESGYVDFDYFNYEMDLPEAPPVIMGIDDGGVYEDKAIAKIPRGEIKLDGKIVDSVYTTAEGEHTLEVTANGMTTSIKFTVEESSLGEKFLALTPIADTSISGWSSGGFSDKDKVYGADPHMAAYNGSGDPKYILLKFNLAPIADLNGTITGVDLVMTRRDDGQSAIPEADVIYDVYDYPVEWDEETATWNTQQATTDVSSVPGLGEKISGVSEFFGGTITMPVSDSYIAEHKGNVISLLVANNKYRTWWYSKEGSQENQPVLNIRYTTEPKAPSSAPVISYNFDETIGAAEPVVVNQDNNLGPLSSVPALQYTDGVKGKALVFDGSFGLKLGSIDGDVHTVSMWIKSTKSDTSLNSVLFGNRDNGTKDSENWISATFHTGKPRIWSKQGSADYSQTNEELLQSTTGEWINYTYTKDENGNIVLYINGEKAGETTDFSVSASNIDFYVGGTFWKGDAFIGELDNIEIYDYALSEDQVVSLYNKYTEEPVLVPYEIKNVETNKEDDGTVTIRSITVQAENSENAIVYVAVYNSEGVLEKVRVLPVTADGEQKLDVNLNTEADSEIKCYMWRNQSPLTDLYDDVSLTEE